MDLNQRIQNYLKHQLSNAERQKFEKDLKYDEELKAQYNEHVSIAKAFKINEAERLKFKLQALEQNEKQKYPFKKRPFYFSIAAAILVLIGLGYYFNFYQSSLYDQYFEVYPNVYQPVVRSNAKLSTKAFMYYENQNYEKAQKEFESVLETDNNPNIRFYYALSLLNTDQTEQTSIELEKLKDIKFEFQAEVYWYYALAEIKLENRALAKKILKDLKSKYPDYKTDEVENLLNEI